MSEEKDKMHLAELEDDVLGDRPIPFTENLYKNYRELASAEIEDLMQQRDELKARIKDLEAELSQYEWNFNLDDAPRDGTWFWAAWDGKAVPAKYHVQEGSLSTEGWESFVVPDLYQRPHSLEPQAFMHSPELPSTQEGDKE
jgi:hypothetical protein